MCDSNKCEWAEFLLEEDVPGKADNSGEPPAVVADLDRNRFYDTEKLSAHCRDNWQRLPEKSKKYLSW